jgi:hypothetical protein
MKKGNQKKHYCITTRIWPSVEKMNKDLLIDLENQKVTNLSTGKVLKQRINNEGYVVISFIFKNVSRTLRLHRLFFYLHHGYLPELVDHKDRNPQNNKINNLRELDDSQNAMNSNKRKSYKNKSTTSIYKGVSWNKKTKKWRASLRFKGKPFYLGSFDSEDDAGQAYNDKIRELGIEETSVLNDTPQERARRNIQFDPLPQEMNHIKDLFLNIEPLVDFK